MGSNISGPSSVNPRNSLPIEDGDGADDGEEVEDALEGLRQRRVERDEVERAVGLVGRHVIGEDVHLCKRLRDH